MNGKLIRSVSILVRMRFRITALCSSAAYFRLTYHRGNLKQTEVSSFVSH
jgi:hypothetical protein